GPAFARPPGERRRARRRVEPQPRRGGRGLTMDRIRIRGGAPLHGSIPISGAKNAALPLMIASLLTEDTLELTNVPRLADISALLRILGNHGVDHAIAGKRPGQ